MKMRGDDMHAMLIRYLSRVRLKQSAEAEAELKDGFERLTNTFVLAIWPFYALGVASIFATMCSR